MNNKGGPFKGRTIQIVRDFSIDEQRYLYTSAMKFKEAILNKDYDYINSHIIDNNNFSSYLLFQENSTRTKESFYNASRFHKVRTKDLPLQYSSLSKNETFTDTVKTLMGYAEQSCFIIRSEIEGMCRWLEISLSQYAEQNGLNTPFCINAGDGRNEHPTQEFLDEFTFHEYYNGDTSHIHIALIGDLLHGRTVHSKVDGLKIFDNVEVDIIAPEEISMPKHYITEMESNGYNVRIFETLDEYIEELHQADLWYFTRLQHERIADDLIPIIERIRSKISLQTSHLEKVKPNARFFHPLPRDKFQPTIPYSVDRLPFNGWDRQSVNGYYMRISLLAMLQGSIGEDFEGESISQKNEKIEFIEEKLLVNSSTQHKPTQKIGIKPVEHGLVIDHIAKGQDIHRIWDRINAIRTIMKFNVVSSHGVYCSHKHDVYKGILSLPNYEITESTQFKKLGAISPGCTINVIFDSKVIKKMKINQPPRIYNFSEISCRNPRCVSHLKSWEQAYADFIRKGDEYYCCNYCKTIHDVNEIWNSFSLIN